MATKGSVFALAVPIAMALLIDAARRFRSRHRRYDRPLSTPSRRRFRRRRVLRLRALCLTPTRGLPPVHADTGRHRLGCLRCAPSRVYAGTLPLGYQLEQFLRWGYGPAAGLLSIVGIALLLGLAIRTRSTTASPRFLVRSTARAPPRGRQVPAVPGAACAGVRGRRRAGAIKTRPCRASDMAAVAARSHIASGVEPGIRLDRRIPVDLRS